MANAYGPAVLKAFDELFTSGTWDLPVVRPGQTLTLTATPEVEECLRRWAWDLKPQTDENTDALQAAYARRDVARTAARHWPQVTVTQIHDAFTFERTPMKPRVSDAQVRLNQQSNWLAVDVVFASVAELKDGEPKGPRCIYKTLSHYAPTVGKLAHVVMPRGLHSVYIAEVRKPTTEDQLTAHAWIVPDGCFRAYEACVASDAKYLEAFAAAERATKLEEELKASLERTAKFTATRTAPIQLRVGGKYRARHKGVVEIVGANRTGLYQDTHPFLASNGLTYTPDGRQDTLSSYEDDEACTSSDLVEEAV